MTGRGQAPDDPDVGDGAVVSHERTPLADEVERHLVGRDVAGALWDDRPCCDDHLREYWSTGTGWPT